MNRVMITGRVTASPEWKYRPDGSPVIRFSLELNGDEGKQETPFRNLINVVAFGKLAESKRELLQIARQVLVIGRLNLRHWKTAEGVHRTQTEIIATDFRKAEEVDSFSNLNLIGGKNEETF